MKLILKNNTFLNRTVFFSVDEDSYILHKKNENIETVNLAKRKADRFYQKDENTLTNDWGKQEK